MVLKYMPYLKQYENGLLRKSDDASTSSADIARESLIMFVLVFTVCL